MISDSIGFTAFLLFLSMVTSAFCSGMESAYLSLDRIAIKKLEKSRSPISRLVLYFVDNLNHLIVSILIFNLFANIIATLSANTLFFWYLQNIWGMELGTHLDKFAWEIFFVINYTLIFLIISEFAPKRITIFHPKFFAEAGAVLMIPVYVIIYPVVFLAFKFASLIKTIFSEVKNGKILTNQPAEDQKKKLPVFRNELLGFVEKIFQQGGFHRLESDWLVQILFHMNTPISSIMINRENLEGLDFESLPEKNLLPLIKKFPHSHIPVYRESKDNIIGIISKKEIALKHRQRFLGKEELSKFIKTALFLPENKNIMEVLKDIYHSDLDVALVADEHGGVEGLVSANHIVSKIFERVVNDESETQNIRQIGPDQFSIRSEVTLDDINHFFGIGLHSELYETIGGYMLENFKTIPKKGETFEDDFFHYVIKSRTPKKIVSIEMRRK